MKLSKTGKWLIYGAFAVALLDILASSSLYMKSRSFVANQETKAQSGSFDAAIVFYSGAVERDKRLQAGYEAYRSGQVQNILIVGGARPDKNFSGAKTWQNQLQLKTDANEAIFAGQGSFDTCSNITAFLGEIQSRNWNTALLFSDPLHTLRINYILSEGNKPTPEITFAKVAYDGGVFAPMRRTQHEILAYISLAIPKSLRRNLLGSARANKNSMALPSIYKDNRPDKC